MTLATAAAAVVFALLALFLLLMILSDSPGKPLSLPHEPDIRPWLVRCAFIIGIALQSSLV